MLGDQKAASGAPSAEAKKAEVKIQEEAPVCDSPLLDGVTAVMPGRILSIKVKEGQAVKAGTVLCILEAMKMENEIRASKDGIVTNIKVSDGAIVSGGDLLMQVC
ncbi:MAG: acetyl-CoA carboxylase biotin carboxyl carrier protein subunit [Dehalococcoidia bacterium]|nr:acetyl-CoA carboxylase biotin carboxyl carrier protein subunit [Dehalococcoidia bacterium]